MQVKLEKKYVIDAPVEAAWTLLRDINSLADCMPGASITEQTSTKAPSPSKSGR